MKLCPLPLLLASALLAHAQPSLFTASQTIALDAARSIATADVNRDNFPDLLVASYSAENVSVLLGTGTGTFTPSGAPIAVGAKPVAIVTADFNSDTRTDFAVLHESVNFPSTGISAAVSIYFGTPNGFAPYPGNPLRVAGFPGTALFARDIDPDGDIDLLAIAGGLPTTILNTGSSNFGTPFSSAPTGGSLPYLLLATLGDFNGDGHPDLAYATDSATDETGVRLGDGQGHFTTSFGQLLTSSNRDLFGATWSVTALSSADINSDGVADLLAASSGRSQVITWLGTLSGMQLFPPSSVISGTPTGTGPSSIAIADFNGDLRTDFITANQTASSISIALRSTTGFTAPLGSPYSAGFRPGSLVTADFNGDARPDLASTQDGGITILLNNGAFVQPTTPQSITFAPLPDAVLGTAPFTLTATATSGLPVTFSTASQACSVTGNIVTLLAVGFCTITATQAGNAQYEPAQLSRGFNITGSSSGQSQTITFLDLPQRSVGQLPFQIFATATSGLAVSFATTTPNVCALTPANVTPIFLALLAPGTCSVTASQQGNTTYLPAPPVSQSFTVSTAFGQPQSLTFNPAPTVQFGGPALVLQATSTSGLPASFVTLTPSVCGVNGGFLTTLTPGSCIIAAQQFGDIVYAPAPPAMRVITILTTNAQFITFDPLADRPISTGPITITATASSGLAVTFTSSTPAVCTVTNATVSFLATGTCTIVAQQAGNGTYAPATPVTRSFIVTPTNRTQTINTATPLTYTLNFSPITITATASSGLPVTFTDTTPDVCTLNFNLVGFLKVGQCVIVATQPGNAFVLPAEPVSIRINITPAPQVPVISSVLNGASYASGRVSPNGYVSVFGQNFGNAPRITIRDSAGVSTIVSQPAYAADTQINFIWPSSTASGQATLSIATIIGSAIQTVNVSTVAPGLFSADSTGSGPAAAQVLIVKSGQPTVTRLVADGPIPVDAGTDVYLVLYGTGLRNRSTGPVIATIGSVPAEVLYAGAQSTFPGLDQVNLKVPAALAGRGTVDIAIAIDGVPTNIVTATFQ